MNERELRQALCSAGKLLAEKGLVHSNLGTISTVVGKGHRVFLTKPGPVHYLRAEPGDFVLVDKEGDPQELNKERPSLNFLVHAACYKVRPDIGAVVHAHPRNVVALVSQKNPKFDQDEDFVFRLLTGEACWFVKPAEDYDPVVPVVGNLDPTPLAFAVGNAISRSNVVAIRNHGIIAVGQDIWEATSAALVIEEEASIIAEIYKMGGTPEFLSNERVRHELSGMPPHFSRPFQQQKSR